MTVRSAWPARRATVACLIALACPASAAGTQLAHAGVDVVAAFHATAHPGWVPWIHAETGRPYRLLDPRLTVAIAPSVIERVGDGPLVAGLTAFNDVPGSAVEVTIAANADPADIRVIEVPCRRLQGKQGRTHLQVHATDVQAAWVDTARIEVCPRLAKRSRHLVRHLMAHELAHVLGFGHLCADRDCWPLDRRPHPCEFMHPSVHPCQDLDTVRAALPTLYPDAHKDRQRRPLRRTGPSPAPPFAAARPGSDRAAAGSPGHSPGSVETPRR